MYNERRDSFSMKDVILQILFVVLFIFIMMWLFPSKQFVKDALEPLYDRIFNENILMMKDSAKSYYTTPRLPQKVGDKVSMTLGDMLDKKIILPFTDSKGRQCDNTASYVEITKMDDEYIMKVNLKCTEQENYLLVYMGCYDYCKTTICEKESKDVKTPTILPTHPTSSTPSTETPSNPTPTSKPKPTPTPTAKPTPTPTAKPTPTPTAKPTPTPTAKPTPTPTAKPTPTPDPTKEYECKYLKVVGASYSQWSNWSAWSVNSVVANDLTDVEKDTKVEYKYEERQIGTTVKTRTVTYKDKNDPIYEKRKVQVGTTSKDVCTQTGTKWVGTGEYQYTEWEFNRTFQTGSKPIDTTTKKYYWDSTTKISCGDCEFGVYQIWSEYVRQAVEVKKEQSYCAKWETQTTPVYDWVNVIVDYKTKTKEETYTEPVYGTVKVKYNIPIYRYRTRTLDKGYRDELWSKCDDKSLLDQGYNWTGDKREKK